MKLSPRQLELTFDSGSSQVKLIVRGPLGVTKEHMFAAAETALRGATDLLHVYKETKSMTEFEKRLPRGMVRGGVVFGYEL